MNVLIPADRLSALCADVFERLGSGREEARRVAASLVGANLAGHDSHGVIRVPRYVDWVRSGDIAPNQTIERVVDAPAIAVVDGRYGFGQTIAPLAVAVGVEKAKTAGLAAISLRNSGHIGRVGEWAEMAAAEGLISIHFVTASGSVLVAPYGGVERRLSTAPFCVGIPRQGAEPVILDFATSLVAEGKIAVASRGGKPLPEGALVGPDGALSSDPAMIYGPFAPDGPRDPRLGEGAIRAFGEHKGSGLALICELLGGSLTGAGATRLGRRFANGMFSLYVDPVRIDPSHFFDQDAARYIDWFRQAKPLPGHTILTPGEPERLSRAKRLIEGVPLPRETRELDRRGGARGRVGGRPREARAFRALKACGGGGPPFNLSPGAACKHCHVVGRCVSIAATGRGRSEQNQCFASRALAETLSKASLLRQIDNLLRAGAVFAPPRNSRRRPLAGPARRPILRTKSKVRQK